jgi:ABC-2 type transport system ATP-binding protein
MARKEDQVLEIIKNTIKIISRNIENNSFDEATIQLMDFVNDFGTASNKQEAIDIRRRYNALKQDKRLFPGKDFDERETRLSISILELLQTVKQYPNLPEIEIDVYNPLQTEPPTNSGKNTWEDQKQNYQDRRGSPSNLASSSTVFLGENLEKTYKKKSFSFTLDIPRFELNLGEITAIVGENGNGKTTLLKIVSGDLLITKGNITYPFLDKNSSQDIYKIKEQIAYIPQELPIWSGLLANNLHFAAAIRGINGKKNEDEVEFIISRLGLDQYRDYSWKEISGGFKMRFSLAKALVWNPKLLILDEPLANLDINTQLIFLQDLRYLVNSIKYPKSIILSSQNIYDIENIADKIIFIKDGKALYNGRIEDFEINRTTNTFELGCNLSKEELTNLLEKIDYIQIDIVGYNQFIIDTSLEVTLHDIFALFKKDQNPNISLNYFRDISKSTRKLFKKNENT